MPRRKRIPIVLTMHPAELTSRDSERKKRSAVRAIVTELKKQPCKDCGGHFPPVCMDFDHRASEWKIDSVSKLMWAGLEKVLREIEKLVCANCHRIRTLNRRLSALTNPAP